MDPYHTASTSSNKVSLNGLLYYAEFSVSGITVPTVGEDDIVLGLCLLERTR